MKWADFYDRFYDWADSTQIRKISELTEFGPSGEVCETAADLSDEKAAARFIRKALDAGVKFTPEEICELFYLVPDDMKPRLLRANSKPYTAEDLEEFESDADEALLEELAEKSGIRLTWPEFYEKFFGWTEHTQIEKAFSLTAFGPPEEVCEIADSFSDDRTAAAFIRKALDAGVKFSPDDIFVLLGRVPDDMKPRLLRANSIPYMEEDLDSFRGMVREPLLSEAAARSRIPFRKTDSFLKEAEQGFWLAVLMNRLFGFFGKKRDSGSHEDNEDF